MKKLILNFLGMVYRITQSDFVEQIVPFLMRYPTTAQTSDQENGVV